LKIEKLFMILYCRKELIRNFSFLTLKNFSYQSFLFNLILVGFDKELFELLFALRT